MKVGQWNDVPTMYPRSSSSVSRIPRNTYSSTFARRARTPKAPKSVVVRIHVCSE